MAANNLLLETGDKLLLETGDIVLWDTPAFQLAASANIAVSGEATTAQLTTPNSHSFRAGRMQDDENPADAVDLGQGEFTELEWCQLASFDAEDSAVYEFRIVKSDGTLLDLYTVTPQWTISVASATPVLEDIPHTPQHQAIMAM